MRIPLYRQIVHTLLQEIADGRYPEGRLASEASLLARYRVSRSTLREALGTLRALGIIQKKQGWGNRIMLSAVGLCCRLDDDRGLHNVIHRLGHEPSCVRSVATDAQEGLVFEEWLLADGRPAVRSRLRLPGADAVQGLDLSDASLQQADVIEQSTGMRPVHAVVQFSSRSPDERLARAFRLDARSVHLRLFETYHTLFDQPIAVNCVDLHPGYFQPAMVRRAQVMLTAQRTAPVTLVERID